MEQLLYCPVTRFPINLNHGFAPSRHAYNMLTTNRIVRLSWDPRLDRVHMILHERGFQHQ